MIGGFSILRTMMRQSLPPKMVHNLTKAVWLDIYVSLMHMKCHRFVSETRRGQPKYYSFFHLNNGR